MARFFAFVNGSVIGKHTNADHKTSMVLKFLCILRGRDCTLDSRGRRPRWCVRQRFYGLWMTDLVIWQTLVKQVRCYDL